MEESHKQTSSSNVTACGEPSIADETERTRSSPLPSQQTHAPAATSAAAPAAAGTSNANRIAAPNPSSGAPQAPSGSNAPSGSQPPEPGSEKRKRGRPKGSTKKVVAPPANSLLLPTSAPMGHSVLMGGWLGASMIGPEFDTSKKSKKPKSASRAKDHQIVPMSLIVQPNQDITEELMRVAVEHDCSVCVLCAHGAVPGVTLKQCLTGVVTTTKGPMELMALNGLVSPQRVVTGGFLNATLSTSGGLLCGSIVGDFQALIHVHVVIGLLKPKQQEPLPAGGATPAAAAAAAAPRSVDFSAAPPSSLPLA